MSFGETLESIGDNLSRIEAQGAQRLRKLMQDEKNRIESQLASGYCERLEEAIKRFDSELDNEHEVALKLVTFGQSITFHVTGIGYHNPGLIMFWGRMDNGQPVELVQHISQISFLMTSLKREDPEKPKRPFGFNQNGVAANATEEKDEASE